MTVSPEQVLPPEYVDFYRLLPLGPASEDGRLFAASPLPPMAAHHYSTGGCFVLAGALEALTGLPLGATLDAKGLPLHAFLVDGSDFVDAFGRQRLAELRARPETVALRKSLILRDIVDLLGPHPNAGKIRGDLAAAESRRYATAAPGSSFPPPASGRRTSLRSGQGRFAQSRAQASAA